MKQTDSKDSIDVEPIVKEPEIKSVKEPIKILAKGISRDDEEIEALEATSKNKTKGDTI